MKTIRVYLFIFSLLITSSLFGQSLQYARQIVDTLASESMKGRGYVENGNKVAADYIKTEFQKIGLKSFPEGYFQYFDISVNTFPKEMSLEINHTPLIPGKDFIVDPRSPSIRGHFSPYIVQYEKLMSPGYLKKIKRNSKGKVFSIDETNKKDIDKNQINALDEAVKKLLFNPIYKNVATVLLSNEKLTWGISHNQFSKPVIIVNSNISSDTIKKLYINISASLTKCETSNIIGYIPGTETPDSFLVFTAHYDHLGMMGKNTIFPGANDNASGIAMLLNLASYFSKHPQKYSLVFMAFSAEELGLFGSKYFIQNPLFNILNIKFLINFDLAGTGDEGIKIVNASIYKSRFEKLKAVNTENNYLPAIKSRGAACNSDHCIFHQLGIPCFYIYTLGGISAYHDIYDRAETLPLSEFEDYYRLMIKFIENL